MLSLLQLLHSPVRAHVSPRGRSKPSENKMQPSRQRPSSSPRLWNDPLLAQGARAHSKPTLPRRLPCTALMTTPCSCSPFPPHLLAPEARGRAGEQRNTWARPTDSCPGLMQSDPQRHWHYSCSQNSSWMINDRDLTTLILLSTPICLMMYGLTEVLKMTSNLRGHLV